jgi:hypothetical protein
VGDDEDGFAAGQQVAGQPVDALDVEMVGRLVEHQQVVVGHQHPGQGHPAALPARECSDCGVQTRGEAGEIQAAEQPGEHLAGSCVPAPVVRLAVTKDDLAHGAGRVQVVVLGQPTQPQHAGMGDPAGIDRLAQGHHVEQGGFPVAVAPDDADALADADAEGDLVEQHPRAMPLDDLLKVDKVARWRGVQDATPGSMARAPCTGPYARLTPRQTPLAVRATARSSPCSWSRTRKATVGPLPLTIPPSAP